jgi:hypothetical protein
MSAVSLVPFNRSLVEVLNVLGGKADQLKSGAGGEDLLATLQVHRTLALSTSSDSYDTTAAVQMYSK